ncbi:D-beta-hydroxybutyrate dehydrogenase [Halobiforma lacisalsi AJ5]|uniref:D-beta-hydroxybutyrate dehydrogenase n=1 Tax=Natronobacterium lacisalsi AJ5 TaxID=358396 RepID=M0LE77_NATLA|nr:SDR family oxidoreductase [Halobiforma lacisalsi]APW96371.1 D-beta-hydroxybutyrate dehydrogenase [Halobiforma lacisalsi AJ5]EMA31862.1 short-chain dehydrogenase/reductase SDR [Halobiforma lacisalsi AJ5]
MPQQQVTPPSVSRDDIHTIPDDSFTGRNVCLVTGAGSGIGRATALAAAGNGLTVAATDVDEAGLEGTVDRAEELGLEGDVEPIAGDLTVDDDIERIVDRAAELGDIKYLANVAGVQHIDAIEDFPMDTYNRMHGVMLRAPLYLSKLCLPHFRETEDGEGCVGNMASVHGHYVTSDKVGYNVSKFGLRGLTQSIAAEGEGAIRSFSISTGYVKTPLVTAQLEETAEQRGISVQEVIEDVMLGQARTTEMMEPIDVGNLFLIGFSDLGRHLNGGDLLFDGGMTLTYE